MAVEKEIPSTLQQSDFLKTVYHYSVSTYQDTLYNMTKYMNKNNIFHMTYKRLFDWQHVC